MIHLKATQFIVGELSESHNFNSMFNMFLKEHIQGQIAKNKNVQTQPQN